RAEHTKTPRAFQARAGRLRVSGWAPVTRACAWATAVVCLGDERVELATEHLTIIRWTTNNPGGSDVHYGIVHYGTGPKDLSQTHPYTICRVSIERLKPRTTSASSRHPGPDSGLPETRLRCAAQLAGPD